MLRRIVLLVVLLLALAACNGHGVRNQAPPAQPVSPPCAFTTGCD